MILTDRGTRLDITVLTTDVAVEVREHSDLEVFMAWWKEIAHGRGVPASIDGADWRLARGLVKTHGLDHLKQLGLVFWSQHADPLVTGEYNRHMILFKAKLAETEKDLANRA